MNFGRKVEKLDRAFAVDGNAMLELQYAGGEMDGAAAAVSNYSGVVMVREIHIILCKAIKR